MKRLSVFVALALVLCFGLAYADRSVSYESVTNSFESDTKLNAGNLHDIDLRVTNTGAPPGADIPSNYNVNNGFRVYSPDGATWSWPARDTFIEVVIPDVLENTYVDSILWLDPNSRSFFNTAYQRVYFSTDGAGADTVGFAGATSVPSLGLTPGTDKPYWRLPIQTNLADTGLNICIDSSWFPPGGTWKWAPVSGDTEQIGPLWSGEKCWLLEKIPNLCPEFVDPIDNYTFSHCETGTFQLFAEDTEGDPITFSLVSGPGSVNASSGVWTWSGPSVPQSGVEVVVIGASDPVCGGVTEHSVNVTVTNEAPAFTVGCGASQTIQIGNEGCFDFTAVDDCDVLTYYVVDDGGLTGAIGFTGSQLCITPDEFNAEGLYTVVVGVEDGELADENCSVDVNVIAGAPYIVRIEKDEGPDGDGAYQGQYTDVDIWLEKILTEAGLGGFNLLIAYDASALSFQQAFEGTIYDECGWEYFEYRYGADGNCGGGCPSGLLRVVGIAETNNGPYHPGCLEPTPYVNGLPTTLATLRFLVSNDRNLECQYAPVRFFWYECGDNTLSSWDGELLFLSSNVFEFDQADPLPMVPTFPNYTGAIAECLEGDKGEPARAIDFYNGGVDIICADSIDARGDVNINGIAYEIADAVMLSNYFITGITAFGPTPLNHQYASVAASDANADGIPLTVADLVYLIRVVVGDAQPYPKTNPVAMNYTVSNGVVSVQGEVGAAFIVAEGEFAPTLIADNMDMKYAHVDGNTRILVYGLDAGDAFTGDFVQVGGEILSIEMATYAGAPIAGENMPTDFSLEQNYPNPFNPTANIRMSLPTRTDWTVTFYNVAGQVVDVVSGTDQGIVEFTWDATNFASGIYFYKLNAGDYTETRKAVLLK